MKSGKQANNFEPKNTRKSTNSNSSQSHNSENSEGEIELDEAIKDFKLAAKAEGRAKKTLDLYNYVFGRFVDYLDYTPQVGNLSPNDLRHYLANLMDEGLKNTSVGIHHRVLKAFFNWLVEEGHLNSSPVANVKEPKTPRKFPRILDEEQVNKLLKTAKSESRDWSGYRNYTIILTFLDLGLRLNELINARLNDLNIRQRSLKVMGKGAKERKVFLGKKLNKSLKHWLKIREEKDRIWDDNIFISERGEKMKDRNLQRRITTIQKKAGLEDIKVSPHVLRHTAATLAVKNGINAFMLQKLFGWENVDTAMRYVHLENINAEETYRGASPIDNLQ